MKTIGRAVAAVGWALALLVAPARAQVTDIKIRALDGAEVNQQLSSGIRHGVLFSASKGDRHLVLYGTIHVGRAAIMPLDAPTLAAMRKSDAFAVEVDITDTRHIAYAAQDYVRMPAGERVDSLVSWDQWQRIKQALEAQGQESTPALHIKPWVTAMSLQGGAIRQSGLDARYGADLVVISIARQWGRPLMEVESMERQMQILDSGSLQDQVQGLLGTLDNLDAGRQARQLRSIFDSWLNADFDGMTRERVAMKADRRRGARETYKALLTDREPDMASRIEDLQKQRQSLFVAVGCLHLVGPDSLVEILRTRGYTIERI